ncbi:MAG: PLP-dependent aminotransferase family protein [bacterium]|nr:PLP-dependent aminotransferase family protein [bacterium]
MKIDKASPVPIYLQIYNNIVDEIINGYLIPEERLPSRRSLSAELGVAQRTVENAYQKLVVDEYVIARPKNGYFVSSERVWDEDYRVMKKRIYNFSTNGVETSKLPFAEWSKLLRTTVREDKGLFQHGEKAGEWGLRKSIRRMLFRTQGIKCRTEQIIIGPGAEDLLRDLFMLLAPESKILLNNCYYYRVHGIAKECRVPIEYIKNGADGIDTEELMRHESGILFQKPTHDLPTSVTLSEDKRRKIIEWLGEGKYVIEDSGENNFQYGKMAKTLWEMSGGENVIYLGSFSKTIAPSMKIGYIVAPDEIVKRWFEKKRFYSNRVSRVEQVTLSKFIDLGHYERHINYMRDIYREKTAAFKKAINSTELGKKSIITGDDAGMYCLVQCDVKLEELHAKELLEQNGVKLSLLTSSMDDCSNTDFPPNTYVVGYGEMTISQIREGVALWSKILAEYL